MVKARLKRLMSVGQVLRLVLAVFALACQISANGALQAAEIANNSDASLLAAASVLCEGVQHKGSQDGPSPHRHGVEQALVSLASSGGLCAALLDDTARLPAPASASIGEAATPPGARAPPVRHVSASFPRGPPNLV